MKTATFDSWPLLEWLQAREPASSYVRGLLDEAADGHLRLLMSTINAAEVYYVLLKRGQGPLAERWRDATQTLPLLLETPVASDIWQAAELKGRYNLSYADAFAAFLALKYHCPLVTGDPDFRSIPHLELDWIGPA